MKITLDTPFAIGDLGPDATYPHVYITTFFVNGPAALAQITYEIGELGAPTDDNPMGAWNKAPYVPTATTSINGSDLYPFFMSKAETGDTPLWDQVEALMYAQIQKSDTRLAGKIG